MLGPLGRFPERRLIVGMNSLDELFHSGHTIPWIKTQNAIAFLRPVPDIVVWTPCPTAGLAQPLRFRQVRFTAPEGLLGPLAIFDVGRDPIPLDDVSIFISERHSAAQLPAILPIRAAGSTPLFESLPAVARLQPTTRALVKMSEG